MRQDKAMEQIAAATVRQSAVIDGTEELDTRRGLAALVTTGAAERVKMVEPTMTLSTRLPVSLNDRLEEVCRSSGLTKQDFVTAALEEAVAFAEDALRKGR